VGAFAVDLEPGERYAFVCFARDPDDDQSHALQGMTSEFRTPAAEGPTTTTSQPVPIETEPETVPETVPGTASPPG
jgi:hypothetical protein